MSNPKDRTGALLKRCLKVVTEYQDLIINSDGRGEERLATLIKDINKSLVYRDVANRA